MEKRSAIRKYGLFIIVCIISVFLGAKLSSFINLVMYKYPALGDYYFWLESDEDGNIIGHTYYHQDIYNDKLDLKNIVIKYRKSSSYKTNRDVMLKDEDVRIFVLEHGIGVIDDDRFATEEEKEAQDKAKNNHVGYWENQVSEAETAGKDTSFSWRNFISKFYELVDKISVVESLKWILISVIGIGTIAAFVYKKLMSCRVLMVMFGEPDSGKTTFCRRIIDPYMQKDVLHEQTIPTTFKEVLKSDSIKHNGINIIPCTVDNPGSKTGSMFDNLSDTFFTGVHATAIIVLSYSDNKQKILQDTSKALIVARTIKQSNRFFHVKKLILFINKADMYYDSFSALRANPENIQKQFSSSDFKELLSLVDCTVCGSALENWNVKDVVDRAINIK